MNGTRSDTPVTTTVSALSDDRLLERTKELSGIEHHLEVIVIDHLREIQKRRLYLRRGFSACCARHITATATQAPDSASAPAGIVRRRSRSAPPPKTKTVD